MSRGAVLSSSLTMSAFRTLCCAAAALLSADAALIMKSYSYAEVQERVLIEEFETPCGGRVAIKFKVLLFHSYLVTPHTGVLQRGESVSHPGRGHLGVQHRRRPFRRQAACRAASLRSGRRSGRARWGSDN